MAADGEGFLERVFGLGTHGTTLRTEILAGFTTFMTMVYIVFVNPEILAEAGMDRGAVFVATCLAAAVGSALMGLYANYPVALAPGMGLNAYFAYTVVKGQGIPWQVALGAVFLSGVLFLLVSITPLRRWVIAEIPKSLQIAIAAGIGFFLAIIGLKAAGVIVPSPATLVTLGNLGTLPIAISLAAFLLTAGLDARRVPGAILIGILAAWAAGLAAGLAPYQGLVSAPPSIQPVLLQMDVAGALDLGVAAIVFTFFFIVVFDNTGTLLAVGRAAKLQGPDGSFPRIERALASDSAAAMIGAALGTSTTTSYIESAAGVNAGGRTGLVAVTVALLFLATLFFAPLVASVPAFATAPALLYVACLMLSAVSELEVEEPTDYVPAAITLIAIPATFSIADGIAMGFIAYAGIKLIAGRPREITLSVAVLAALFLAKFAFL